MIEFFGLMTVAIAVVIVLMNAGVALLLMKLFFGLLPFRLLGWLLVLPLLLVKLMFGLFAGLALLPVLGAGLLGGALVLVVLPIVPLLLMALTVWVVMSAARPTGRPTQPFALLRSSGPAWNPYARVTAAAGGVARHHGAIRS